MATWPGMFDDQYRTPTRFSSACPGEAVKTHKKMHAISAWTHLRRLSPGFMSMGFFRNMSIIPDAPFLDENGRDVI
jgi:hypothetical protein